MARLWEKHRFSLKCSPMRNHEQPSRQPGVYYRHRIPPAGQEGVLPVTDQPPTAYVAARRVGDATITIISEAAAVGSVGLPIPEAELRQAIPEADLRGMISFGLNLAHINLAMLRSSSIRVASTIPLPGWRS